MAPKSWSAHVPRKKSTPPPKNIPRSSNPKTVNHPQLASHLTSPPKPLSNVQYAKPSTCSAACTSSSTPQASCFANLPSNSTPLTSTASTTHTSQAHFAAHRQQATSSENN